MSNNIEKTVENNLSVRKTLMDFSCGFIIGSIFEGMNILYFQDTEKTPDFNIGLFGGLGYYLGSRTENNHERLTKSIAFGSGISIGSLTTSFIYLMYKKE